ncbi:MAG: OsmC family protein [Bryobacteraceae bacterium]|jgi:organic hydroperoxide reductase OsmC/OhrA
MSEHHYQTSLHWTGNTGQGTQRYTSYARDHEISGPNKLATIPGSSDPYFRGDPGRYNPEELLLAALSACHMLSYLHQCAVNGVVVAAYEDNAEGAMVETADGAGHFTAAILRPSVTIAPGSDPAKALHLHDEAARLCFIANSVRFPVTHQPTINML